MWQFILGLIIGTNCGLVIFALIKAGSEGNKYDD